MPFLSESGCKGRAFFNTRKTFSSFFWKKIFRKFRTADLQHLKLKFRTEDNFHTNYNNTLLFIAREINSQAIRLTPIRPYVLPQQDHTSYQGKTYGLPAEARRLIAVTVAFNAPATAISQKNKELWVRCTNDSNLDVFLVMEPYSTFIYSVVLSSK